MKSQYKSAYAKKRANKRKAVPKRSAPKRKTVSDKRSAVVKPTRVAARVGYMSQSRWLSTIKSPSIVKTMAKLGAPNVYTTNGVRIQNGMGGCYSIGSIVHQPASTLGAVFAQDQSAPSNLGPRRLLLESYIGTLNYTNGTNAPCEMELYDLVLKKDLPYTHTVQGGVPPNAITTTLYDDPVAYILRGIQTGAGSAGGGFNPTFPTAPSMMYGSSVYDSQYFKDYFKVVKRTIVELTGGSTHTHTVSLKSNRLLKQEETNSSVISGIRGVTCFTLALVRTFGSITQLTADPLTDIETTAASRISCHFVSRYKYTYVADNASSVGYLNTLYRVPDQSTGSYTQAVVIPQNPTAAPQYVENARAVKVQPNF